MQTTTLAGEMRDTILSEATRLFVRHGFDGVSMREIAEACGLSKAGLYYHFKDKEDLFLAMLDLHLRAIDRAVTLAQNTAGGAREQVRALVRALFLEVPAELRAVMRLSNQELQRLSPEKSTRFSQSYTARFTGPVAELLAAGMAAGELRQTDPQVAMWALLGMIHPFFTHVQPGDDQAEALVDQLVNFYFEGFHA